MAERKQTTFLVSPSLPPLPAAHHVCCPPCSFLSSLESDGDGGYGMPAILISGETPSSSSVRSSAAFVFARLGVRDAAAWRRRHLDQHDKRAVHFISGRKMGHEECPENVLQKERADQKEQPTTDSTDGWTKRKYRGRQSSDAPLRQNYSTTQLDFPFPCMPSGTLRSVS